MMCGVLLLVDNQLPENGPKEMAVARERLATPNTFIESD